jgi:hypothetical protein
VSSKPKPQAKPNDSNDRPQGYQPTLGRKLFMLALCIIGLVIVWTYYLKN